MDELPQGQTASGSERRARMEAVMAEHEGPLLRYAARIVGNGSAAEDVVQNVFIKLFRAWTDGQHPAAGLKYWLYRVTHNEAVDHIRRESRIRRLHEDAAREDEVHRDGGDGGASGDERRGLVLGALRRLSGPEQQIILLRLQEGLSYREISEVTGRSEGNVGNLLHHAVKKISAAMQKAGARS